MSDSPTSPGLNGSLQPRQLKKRKPTYLVRREEAKALEDQVHALQNQLAALQEAKVSNNIALIAAKNEMMRASLHSQQLAMASLQSMMFHHVSNQSENPLYTYIHLPQQRAARRETLVDMKDDKLLQCYNYLMARSGNLNMVKDHYAGDKYEDANGNLVCHRFDVTHFCGLKSLKQVYDALVFFMFNMEISISETLGDITVRDDYDSINDGAYISNHRLISNHESGVTSEANTATFAQYFDGPNQFKSSSCAILTSDNVDDDELHPYNSHELIRRDVSAAVVLTEEQGNAQNQGDNGDGEELVVVMRRVAFMKIYNPSFEVPEDTLLELNDRILQWPKVMLQAIRELVDA